MVKILIKKLNSKVKLPTYKTDGSSGMDLMAFLDKPVSIMPQKSELIKTGISIAFLRTQKYKFDLDQDWRLKIIFQF